MSSKHWKYAQKACVSSWNLKTCCALPQTKSVIWIAWLLKCEIRICVRESGWLGVFPWGVKSLGFWGLGMWVLAGQSGAVQAVQLIPNSVHPSMRVSVPGQTHLVGCPEKHFQALPSPWRGVVSCTKGIFLFLDVSTRCQVLAWRSYSCKAWSHWFFPVWWWNLECLWSCVLKKYQPGVFHPKPKLFKTAFVQFEEMEGVLRRYTLCDNIMQ